MQLRAGRAPPPGGDHLGDPPGDEGGDDQRIDEVGEEHRPQHAAAAEPLHLAQDGEGGDREQRPERHHGPEGCLPQVVPAAPARQAESGVGQFVAAHSSVTLCPARLLPSYIILLPRVTRMSRKRPDFPPARRRSAHAAPPARRARSGRASRMGSADVSPGDLSGSNTCKPRLGFRSGGWIAPAVRNSPGSGSKDVPAGTPASIRSHPTGQEHQVTRESPPVAAGFVAKRLNS